MYYTVEERNKAIRVARTVIKERTKGASDYTWGYNDCWSLFVEYDKALRGDYSFYNNFSFNYSGVKGFFLEARKQGLKSLKDIAIKSNYEIIKTSRPELGDIAFDRPRSDYEGATMIAGNGCWITTTGKEPGTSDKKQLFFLERNLSILARPLRNKP